VGGGFPPLKPLNFNRLAITKIAPVKEPIAQPILMIFNISIFVKSKEPVSIQTKMSTDSAIHKNVIVIPITHTINNIRRFNAFSLMYFISANP